MDVLIPVSLSAWSAVTTLVVAVCRVASQDTANRPGPAPVTALSE
jgi:hypothetical protein